MSKLSFRARALDASKPMPIYLAEELPDLPDYSAINRAVPQMPSGMEKEEESEHHLQRAISGTGLIIPTPEVSEVTNLEFYERCYPPDYKMPKQHIHMQPLWEEQETPEYDIDTEDERWLKQQRHSELTELLFEQMMDKLEKCSGQTVVTLSEATLLLGRKDDLVIAVYDYWLNKRLNTQHALVLSVKTEGRAGQSTNNPYLAFRRRTEKMQTRKNRKNDESSYEKMLKLRRDLARALTLLQLVARREEAKRDMVRLTARVADKRYVARDFASQLLPEPPPRPQYTPVALATPPFRRETYYPPRAPATPIDQPRQREKRPYKRRKYRHQVVGSALTLREPGVFTSSEEEGGPRPETASPPDDGPFTFRRKPGCYYEMPTSTLCGDPVDPDAHTKDGLFQHELDVRHRYTLTSLSHPHPQCIGFTRRRRARGGRVALDRVGTPLDDLWPRLHFAHASSARYRKERAEEVEFETKAHRTPMEMSRDYHTSGKHPWRYAFRRHLARNPNLWTADVKTDVHDVKLDAHNVKLDAHGVKLGAHDVKLDAHDVKLDAHDVKLDAYDVKLDAHEVKTGIDDVKLDAFDVKLDVDEAKMEVNERVSDLPQDSDISVRTIDDNGVTKSDTVLNDVDREVRANLDRVMRKRLWSGSSDSSYDSDESLKPVEREFESFINEVNKKWLHFRPKTPPATQPDPDADDDRFPLDAHTPVAVELRPAETAPSECLDPFTTAEFCLRDLCGDGASLDMSGENLLADYSTGLPESQDPKALETDTKGVIQDALDLKESFLWRGQSLEGRAGSGRREGGFGSSVVRVLADSEPVYVQKVETKPVRAPTPPRKIVTPVKEAKTPRPAPAPAPAPTPAPSSAPAPAAASAPAIVPAIAPVLAPVPNNRIIVEEVNEVPPQIKLDKKKAQDTIEEYQLAHGVQLKTVQTKHSPLKKHIITSSAPRRAGDVTLVTAQDSPQIVTVAVSDSLKVRLQNHLLASQAGVSAATVVGLVPNGPLHTVSLPAHAAHATHVQAATHPGLGGVTVVSAAARRAPAPLVQLAPAAPPARAAHAHAHALHHVAHNKLKVLHAHPLTQTQRTQLLAQNRSLGQLPAVVSLATLGEAAKGTNTALLKAAPGSMTQFFEIKSGQLGKGPHLVNVVRQPQPGKAVARLDLNDAKKRQVVATFDGAALKGSLQAVARPHRVNVSLDGRQLVRAALPTAVRAPHVRHQIQLKNRTFQMATPIARAATEPSTSITVSAPTKTASIPSSVVANLLQKNVQLPKGGQKIAIARSGAPSVAANVQAIAFPAAQLRARGARLLAPHAQSHAQAHAEIVDAAPAAAGAAGGGGPAGAAAAPGEPAGGVRRRPADSLPMEVT